MFWQGSDFVSVQSLHNWWILSLKIGLWPSKIKLCYLSDWKPFKNDEKCFLFHLKSSFRSKDKRLFGHVGKTAWLERLTSKFMTSQAGLQTIAIHILPNISQSKGNQTMKVCQLIDYNKRNNFLQKLCGKWSRDTSSIPLLIF